MKYKVGDTVNIDDVNDIKNTLYNKAFDSTVKNWPRVKKEIKKRVTFKIISL